MLGHVFNVACGVPHVQCTKLKSEFHTCNAGSLSSLGRITWPLHKLAVSAFLEIPGLPLRDTVFMFASIGYGKPWSKQWKQEQCAALESQTTVFQYVCTIKILQILTCSSILTSLRSTSKTQMENSERARVEFLV